ncbi:MAG TPA: CBS domain-containing protein [Thermoanaerobaculia bacterium]|nr:CBS domain-containing protein [Thermoanaerobaculia bacterium]
MKVKECMTPTPATCAPTTTLRLVAQLMADLDCAAIPVAQSGTVVGIITDRDIACRAVPSATDAPNRPAAEFMSAPVIAVGPDDSIETAASIMEENRVHHLPVLAEDGRLLGIVAQSDLGRRMTNREFGALARSVSIRRPPVRWGRVDAIVKSNQSEVSHAR